MQDGTGQLRGGPGLAPWRSVTERRLGLALFLLMWLVAGWPLQPNVLDNERTRYFMTAAMVDHGTLSVDPWREHSGDLSINHETGRLYGNKVPGAPLLAVPAYAAWRWLGGAALSGDLGPGGEPALAGHLRLWPRWWVKLWAAALPFAGLCWGLWRLAVGWGVEARGAMLVVLGFGFGTIGFQHGMLFSGHVTAVAGMVLGWCLWERARATERRGWLVAGLGGLVVGLGALADSVVMWPALCLTVYAVVSRRSWADLASWLIGGGLMAALLMAYNQACFGSPLSMPMAAENHLTETFAAGASGGILGIRLPRLDTLWRLLVSPSRGTLLISPVLILGAWGWWRRWRQGARSQVVLVAAIVIGNALMISGFYGWHSGWSYGARYLMPLIALLALGLAWVPRDRYWLPALLAVSVLQVVLVGITSAHIPVRILNPIPEFTVALLTEGIFLESPASWLGLPNGLAIGLYAVGCIAAATWLWRRAVALDTPAEPAETATPETAESTPAAAADPVIYPWPVQLAAVAIMLGIVLAYNLVATEPRWLHLSRAAWVQAYMRTHDREDLFPFYRAEYEDYQAALAREMQNPPDGID